MEPMQNEIFLSIVIATYNYGKFLQAAIDSVVNQSLGVHTINGRNVLSFGDDTNVELIVVDGGSADASVTIIKKNAEKIAWWISEPDGGQSCAFNKGFAHSVGRYLTWLNADDLLMPGTIKAVNEAFRRNPWASWATGNFVRFHDGSGKILQAAWGPHVWPIFFQKNGFPIPAFGPTTFWSRDAYEDIGPINEQLHYTMDIEYWKRLVMGGRKFVRINHCCWGFRMHEESKTAEFGNHERPQKIKDRMKIEQSMIVKSNGHVVTKWGCYIMTLVRILDGSAFVDLWRRLFYCGRTIQSCYGIDYRGAHNED